MSNTIFIDSKNVTGTITNGSITLHHSIFGKWLIDSFTMVNNIYNVDANNKSIVWNYNGTNITSTLTEGFYNGSELVTHLASVLTSDSAGTFSGSFNENTNKMTITETGGVNFYINFTNTNNGSLFGFGETTTSNSSSLTSSNACDLVPYKNFFIKFNDHDNHIIGTTNYFQATVSLCDRDSTFGSLIRYKADKEVIPYYVSFDKITKTIEFKIIDKSQREMQLNNSNWEMILKKVC